MRHDLLLRLLCLMRLRLRRRLLLLLLLLLLRRSLCMLMMIIKTVPSLGSHRCYQVQGCLRLEKFAS